jgi:hypothetical protein
VCVDFLQYGWHLDCLFRVWWPPCPMEWLLANLKPEARFIESGLQILDMFNLLGRLVASCDTGLQPRVPTQKGFLRCMFFRFERCFQRYFGICFSPHNDDVKVFDFININ